MVPPGSMWSEKNSGWRAEPCRVAAFAEQMGADEPVVGPKKNHPRHKQSQGTWCHGILKKEGVINYFTSSKEIQ